MTIDPIILSPQTIQRATAWNTGIVVDLNRGPWAPENTEHIMELLNTNADPDTIITFQINIKLSDFRKFTDPIR